MRNCIFEPSGLCICRCSWFAKRRLAALALAAAKIETRPELSPPLLTLSVVEVAGLEDLTDIRLAFRSSGFAGCDAAGTVQ